MHTESDYLKICPDELNATSLAELIQRQSLLPLWFTGIDFSGHDLSRLNLQGARFERCLFAGSNLTATRLVSTKWLNCQAAQPMFCSAILVYARFVSYDLKNTRWRHSTLAYASFDDYKLTDANFIGIYILGLSFSYLVRYSTCLSGHSFYKSQLRGLDFAAADLSYCDFHHTVFLGGGKLIAGSGQ